MNRKTRRRDKVYALLVALAVLLACSGCFSRTEEEEEGDPWLLEGWEIADETGDHSPEAVLRDVSLDQPGRLIVTRPSMDFATQAERYYLTGCSDPSLPLELNGEAVEHRGRFGSFGVYVELEEGENVFTFTQGEGGPEETVTITQGGEVEHSAITTVNSPQPEADVVLWGEETATLQCIAPSGASVTARVGNETVELAQRAATEVEGIAATFTAEYTAPSAAEVEELGTVTYSMEWNGESASAESEGRLFAAGQDAQLLVRVKDVSVAVFAEEDDEGEFYSALQQGAVDIVLEKGETMYRLGMGGWVIHGTVEPVAGAGDYHNEIHKAEYEVREDREILTLRGTSPAPSRTEWSGGDLVLTLFHTTGFSPPDMGQSNLFSRAAVSESGGHTVFRFTPQGAQGRSGRYLVRYEENDTVVTFFHASALSEEEGARPLEGLTIVLDPGHGGGDEGASGIPRGEGPVEKDITLAYAHAVGTYLKAQGATVYLTKADDSRSVDLNERLERIQREGVDLAASLHCNSISYAQNGTGASGVEVYYYNSLSQDLAMSLQDSICAATGRADRGARRDYYRVTLSSNVPSVMVEMGFLTNPEEYDSLCDPEEIYRFAQAVERGIRAAMS